MQDEYQDFTWSSNPTQLLGSTLGVTNCQPFGFLAIHNGFQRSMNGNRDQGLNATPKNTTAALAMNGPSEPRNFMQTFFKAFVESNSPSTWAWSLIDGDFPIAYWLLTPYVEGVSCFG